MKLFRFALHTWITMASVLSFLLGWVALAHAPKPVQHTQASVPSSQSVPTLAPLQNLRVGDDQGSNNASQTFQTFQAPSNMPAPVFRTGGS